MNSLKYLKQQRQLRTRRVRLTTRGTTDRPRLSVHITHQHVSAQIIDDSKHVTVAAASTVGQKQVGKNLTERAVWVGEQIAAKAQAVKVKRVVFDRGARLYHGRVAALANAAREKGLEF